MSPNASFQRLVAQQSDFSKLIDLRNFSFIINKQCESIFEGSNGHTPFTVVLIYSVHKSLEMRNTIRQTWGSQAADVRLIFLLAAVDSKKQQEQLAKEDQQFNDILQGNFVDAYRNLTYKHAMALKWFHYYCTQSTYLIRMDDDVLLHTPYIYKHLQNGTISNKELVLCSVLRNAAVYRSHSKWAVTKSEYPNDTYPPYCPGGMVIYSSDVVHKLYAAAQQTPYFWLEDVHITGTLVQKIGLNLTSCNSYCQQINGRPAENLPKTFLFSRAEVSSEQVRKTWSGISNWPIGKF